MKTVMGCVYRLVEEGRERCIFQRVSQPTTFEDFKKAHDSLDVRIISWRREGHAYIFFRGKAHPPYGLFVPCEASKEDILAQIKGRWGLASELREDLLPELT